MKIYLFLINQIVSFNLPKEVFGSFSFDENDNADTKLINIEARDGRWVLYSTSDVSILDGNQIAKEIPITSNNYYVLRFDFSGMTVTNNVDDIFKNFLIRFNYNNIEELTNEEIIDHVKIKLLFI